MRPADSNPWIRNWTIVRADLDIAHVMLPLSNFRLHDVNTTGANISYQLVHNHQAPVPDCFSGAVLMQTGRDEPSFFEITGLEQLPTYDQDTAAQYVNISETMGTYLAENTNVQRLEGVIRIPCHAHGAQIPKGASPGHSPVTIKTTVQFYQFPNAVDGGLSLLVVRTPLSPACPVNGDGTAVGVGKH